MVEKRGLGRGLSALLEEVEETEAAPGSSSAGTLQDISVELIRRNEQQPRWIFPAAELEELAASIRMKGVLQPVLLRLSPEVAGYYEVVAGERRWRAAQLAGLTVIPALIRELSDSQVLELGIIENVQREALNPIEEASAYQQLVDRYGRTHGDVADVVGKSRAHVANAVRLLKLPQTVRDHVLEGRLSAGHGRAVLAAEDPEALAEIVVAKGLSVRETELLARKPLPLVAGPRRTSRPPAIKDADTQALEGDLAEALGLAVEVVDRGGQGEVRIKYATLEQLDEICRRLTKG